MEMVPNMVCIVVLPVDLVNLRNLMQLKLRYRVSVDQWPW